MCRAHKSFDNYIQIIPEEYRNNLILLEDFNGNRTNISFTFSCGCSVKQCLKAFLTRDRFDFCTNCKPKSVMQTYICTYCGTTSTKENHIKECEEKYKFLVEGEDYVVCKICNFHAQNICSHLKKNHNINPKNYDGDTLCSKSRDKYAKSASENSWLKKAKENNEDLIEYWLKVGKGVKEAILSNPEERKRRAEVMTKVNQSDVMRQKASETAKQTSSCPEILEARSKRLKIWRNNNPELFKIKCTDKMLNSWRSKPEKILFEFVSLLDNFSFKANQRIKSENFISSTKEKQIDMADKNKRIYIEYDGLIHFKNLFGEKILIMNKKKDELLEQHMLKHNWTLIRVSYDQFIYRSNKINKVKIDSSYFKQECLDKILEILNSNQPGIYKIGEAYGKH